MSPILAEQKHGNIGRVKSLLGTWRGFISSASSERARFHLQITAIKFLVNRYKVEYKQLKSCIIYISLTFHVILRFIA